MATAGTRKHGYGFDIFGKNVFKVYEFNAEIPYGCEAPSGEIEFADPSPSDPVKDIIVAGAVAEIANVLIEIESRAQLGQKLWDIIS